MLIRIKDHHKVRSKKSGTKNAVFGKGKPKKFIYFEIAALFAISLGLIALQTAGIVIKISAYYTASGIWIGLLFGLAGSTSLILVVNSKKNFLTITNIVHLLAIIVGILGGSICNVVLLLDDFCDPSVKSCNGLWFNFGSSYYLNLAMLILGYLGSFVSILFLIIANLDLSVLFNNRINQQTA